MPVKPGKAGIKAEMDKWEAGTLHSGSKTGPIVKSQKQAVAIALNQQRKAGANKAKPWKGF